MVILGLTGSIGMGKSTVAGMLRHHGVPVHDSDAMVHRLLGPGGQAVAAVEAAFPGVLRDDGAIDRPALGGQVFGNVEALRRLEKILHPLVGEEKRRFLRRSAARRIPVVAADVPLLFETGGDRNCDASIVVSAPDFIQAQRVTQRPGMTPEKLADIRARQMPDAEKRRRADFILHTGQSRRATLRKIRRIINLARNGQLSGRRKPGRRRGARHA